MVTGGGSAVVERLDRHVPRIALDWIVQEPERTWRVVDGTMVFADISGFTALSERLATRGRIGTEELVETLSRVFGSMLDITDSHGGQLLKFGGDALLLLFTGPDHAHHAASAAVEMRRELRRAAEVPTSVGHVRLSISIGAHSGGFHLFLVGEDHRQLVVLGPDTTHAMCCEGAAEAGEIVVSDTTAALLGRSSVTARGDGRLLLRWRKAAIDPCGHLPSRDDAGASTRLLVPPIMAGVLERGRPDPVHRIATVAFLKFSGTDEWLARDGPDALARALHDTLRIAGSAFALEDVALFCVDVDANGGKLFCSSGVPLTSEDDEGRMLRAVHSIIAAGPPLALRVGINRGHVFAAELGSARQAAFSVMSDTVNTAARIMATAPPGSIHAHPSVLEHARTRYETRPVGPFQFKGKAQPQVVYEVGDELGPRATFDRDALPLLGRAVELAELRQRVRAVEEGRGDVVTVTGAVGLGKSRLVRGALTAVDASTVITVHAEPYGANSSYRVVRDPLRDVLGIARGDQATMATMLRSTIRGAAPHLEPYLPLLGDIVQIDIADTPEVASIAPRFRPDRTADVIIELLAELRPGPLVVTAEDMHWADDASSQLLGRLASETAVRPWLLIVVRRDLGAGFVADRGSVLELGPLPATTIRDLTIAASEAAPLRPHEIDLVVERAAGSPLFVGELIATAQELGSLEAVPESLQGTLAAQVDALDPLSRRVLSFASVLGRSFRRTVLAELLEREGLLLDPATMDQLDRFIEADGPDRYRFRNGLVCDVVYDGLAYRSRTRLHRRAGEALEQISGDLVADADLLSMHFSRAGDHERTYRYAVMAAERAERAHVNAAAAIHYERAVESSRRLPHVSELERRRLLLALGDVRDRAGLLDDALEAYRRAAMLVGDDDLARADLHLRRARVRQRAGAFRLALREATRAQRVARRAASDDAEPLRARALAFGALVRQRQERAAEALRAAHAAAAEAISCDDRLALARAYNVISWAGLVLGRDDTNDHARRALELYEEVGDLGGQADMANNLGVQAYFEGRWSETLDLYRQSVDACRREGNLVDAATTEANIGEVLVNQGRLDEAEPVLRDAARVLRSSGYVSGAAFAEMHLGRLLAFRGDLGAAQRVLRSRMDELTSMGRTASAYETSLHLADCLTRSGDPQQALALIARTAAQTSEDVSIFDSLRAAASARALIELGFVDEAIMTIAVGVEHARARGLEFDLARLLLLAGRLGPPFDPRLGTTEPGEEAHYLLDRLGVITTVSS